MALSGYGRPDDDLLPLHSIPCTLKTGIHLVQVLQTRTFQVMHAYRVRYLVSFEQTVGTGCPCRLFFL